MLLNLADGLAARGVSVDIVTAAMSGELTGLLPTGASVCNLRASRVATALPKLRAFLRARRPQILVSTLSHANVVAILAARSAGVATRVVVREAIAVNTATRNDPVRWRGRAVRAAIRATYPRSDAIVAVSEGVKAELLSVLRSPAPPVIVFKNPVFTPRLSALSGEPIANSWFDSKALAPIVAVGRLTPQKNFGLLIRAFALAKERRPDLRLVICGDGEERARLSALITALRLNESVRLEGFVENPYSYMARARGLVLSSLWEGSPNVLVEALACGCPVVATDCPTGPREILEQGRFGQLVPLHQPEALAEAIVRMVTVPQDRIALTTRAREYSLETATDRYLGLFNGIAEPADK
jgi:glycosyltransferase involved in cell wall biosynthesis